MVRRDLLAAVTLTVLTTCLAGAGPAAAAPRPGALAVRVARLPAPLRGRVVVTGAHLSRAVARTTTLRLPPGRYRVAAGPVTTAGGTRYFPAAASQRIVVRPAKTTRATVDYATIVPPSTHTPPASSVTAVSRRIVALRSAVAARYRTGDVIGVGVSRRTPNGLMVRIAGIAKRTAQAVSFRIRPATLAQALPRTVVDARVPATTPARPIAVGCGAARASVTAGLGVGVRVHLETGGRRPRLTAATFRLRPTARTGVTLTAGPGGSCSVTRAIGARLRRVTIHAGPVPIVAAPRVAGTLKLAGDYVPGSAATSLQTITGTLRLAYDGRAWRASSHLARTTRHSLGAAFQAPMSARAFTATITPTATIAVDGVASPRLRIHDSPSLSFSPAGDGSLALAHMTSVKLGVAPHAITVLKVSEPLEHRARVSTTQVSAGAGGMTCALPRSARLYCWGPGPLGDGTAVQSPRPVAIGLAGVRQVSGGDGHTCAVLTGGGVDCWGLDTSGQVGNGVMQSGPVLRPVAVQGITTAVQVSAGGSFTCALLADGTVRCWGADGSLQIGAADGNASAVPVRVAGITNASQISAGRDHVCALLANRTVTCWGAASGTPHGDDVPPATAFPVGIPTLAAVAQVSAGTKHTCALLRSGLIECWGDDSNGELGDGVSRFTSRPVPVILDSVAHPAAQVSADDFHTCALLRDGTARCWGVGDSGQLGSGSVSGVTRVPVAVSGLRSAVRISSGGTHVCAVLASGAIDCWGGNGAGQLGTGTPDVTVDVVGGNLSHATTARTVALAGVRQVSAGHSHRCAVLDGGAVDCWGLNDHLELGALGAGRPSSTPVPVAGLAPAVATQVSAGANHTCARLQGGTVACWGWNDAGQLGSTSQGPAALVAGITTAVQVAAGGEHSCALLAGGSIDCWGVNDHGQLGNGTTTASPTPVRVSGITTAVQISAGESHTCAVLQSGAAECWGDGVFGQLGNGGAGNNAMATVPGAVTGISGGNPAAQVAAGPRHTCAVLRSGAVDCWGAGSAGQLGDGLKTNSPTPVLVAGVGDATGVTTGLVHSCAVRSGGGVACWGADLDGQIGDGSTLITAANVVAPSPVAVRDVGRATQVVGGGETTCARLANGTAACWGAGPLGDGESGWAAAPVPVVGLP